MIALRTDVEVTNPTARATSFAHWTNVPLVPGGTNELLDDTVFDIPTARINISKRWRQNLDPSIKREPWTKEEDETLIALYRQHGSKWAQIASGLPGRTDNACKNQWNKLSHTASPKQPKTVGRPLQSLSNALVPGVGPATSPVARQAPQRKRQKTAASAAGRFPGAPAVGTWPTTKTAPGQRCMCRREHHSGERSSCRRRRSD